jgi:hypothetical protein
MAWHTAEDIATEGFLARGDQHYKGAVSMGLAGTLNEIGEGHETSVTLIAEVGNDARGESGFSYVALHLDGYRFGI